MRTYIKDIIYGANDGIITTFAIISGVVGAGLSNGVILIVGFASLIADGFSMASSNYLGTKSEHEVMMAAHRDSPETHYPFESGAVTFIAFISAGVIPLLPYILLPNASNLFFLSFIFSGGGLFFIGAWRSKVTNRGALLAGLEMLLIGGSAALIAFLVGGFVKSLVA